MQKLFFVVGGLAVLLIAGFFALARSDSDHALVASPALIATGGGVGTQVGLRFEDFVVPDHVLYQQVQPAEVSFENAPELKEYEDELWAVVSRGPNFAGHFVLAELSCGEHCLRGVVIRIDTGEIIAHDLIANYGFQFRNTSSLLVVNQHARVGKLADLSLLQKESFSTNYYLIENNSLQLVIVQDVDGTIEGGCPELPVTAVHLVTEETRVFDSRCRVPNSWNILVD